MLVQVEELSWGAPLRSVTGLVGRQAESAALERLLAAVRGGESRTLLIRGAAGVGKSALLDHLARRASGFRVVRIAGVPAESELVYSALHLFCAPLLDRLGTLPEPQRDALGTAFGLQEGLPPDRFFVGLAVLGLLAAVEERPLLFLIDDAQWLDRASAQVLAFVARRLRADSVSCVFAVRDAGAAGELAGLPGMRIGGLRDADARQLLRVAALGPIDGRVRDRIVAEAGGNPRALLELTPAELAGGFGTPAGEGIGLTSAERIGLTAREGIGLTAREGTGLTSGEDGLERRLGELPAGTRELLLLAAAEPLGDPLLLWRAAGRLGVDVPALAAAHDLVGVDGRVRFRQPGVRAAVYQAAMGEDRRRIHRALAEATDTATDPDRRAWHHALGAAGPDEEIAADLEHTAARARTRGGVAAVAAFLERAAALTPDPGLRAERALAAARAKHLAGASTAALALLESAQLGPFDEARLARIDLLRAEIAHSTDPGALLEAARRLPWQDAALTEAIHLQALAVGAAPLHRAAPGGRSTADDSQTVSRRPTAGVGQVVDERPAEGAGRAGVGCDGGVGLLGGALGELVAGGPRRAAAGIRRALGALPSTEITADGGYRWVPAACTLAMAIGDDTTCRDLLDRHTDAARRAGALGLLPAALGGRILLLLAEGRPDDAASANDELERITAATGARAGAGLLGQAPASLVLTAWRGSEQPARPNEDPVAQWLGAVHLNGAGRYAEALEAARRACAHLPGVLALWGPAELVELATRQGRTDLARAAFDQLTEAALAGRTDWGLGMEARARALLGQDPDHHFRAAIARLERTRMRADLARTHLLYGEHLRAEQRRNEAREHLRTALELFAEAGMDGFAARAEHELAATGATTRRRGADTAERLTPQEARIAELARTGLTNKEIATRLHVSPRTVEYHLHKVFAKQGVTSRTQLRQP